MQNGFYYTIYVDMFWDLFMYLYVWLPFDILSYTSI